MPRPGRCARRTRPGFPQTNDTLGVTGFLSYLQSQVQHLCVQSSHEKSSAWNTECETKGGPVGNLTPGAVSVASDQNGFRIKKIRRGERLPGLETGPNTGLQPFSFPQWKQLLENRKSSEKESSDACLPPGREESSLSGSQGTSHLQARGRGAGGWAASGRGAGPAPSAGARRAPVRSAEREGGGAHPQHPGRAWRRLERAASTGLRAQGQCTRGGGGGGTPRAGASRRLRGPGGAGKRGRSRLRARGGGRGPGPLLARV